MWISLKFYMYIGLIIHVHVHADIVAMLMDPISYATQVLKEMDEDLVSQWCIHCTLYMHVHINCTRASKT